MTLAARRSDVADERRYLAAMEADLERLRKLSSPAWEITKAEREVRLYAELVARMEENS
jgi:hypothetical protein